MKIADLIVVALVIVVGIGSLCYLQSPSLAPQQENTVELTQEDAFARKDITGNEMTLRGLKIGDTYEKAIEIFGVPDNQPSYDGYIVNLEYSKRMGYANTVLIINLQNNTVNRITMYKPLDEHFKGKTKFTDAKRGVYDTYGVPAQQILTHKNIWVYSYPQKGYDVLLYEKKETGLSIYAPIENSKT